MAKRKLQSTTHLSRFTLKGGEKSGNLSPLKGSRLVRAIVTVESAAPGDGGTAFSIVKLAGNKIAGGSTFALKRR